MNNVIKKAAFLAVTFFAASSVSAQTYVVDANNYSYSGATKIEGFINTNAIGTFTTRVDIENVLSQSTFGFSLFNGTTKLSEVTSANSAWQLILGDGASLALTITNSAFSLDFSTPFEYTEGRLILQSPDLFTVFQFSQFNNVSDYNSSDLGYNAVHGAYSNANYGSTFVLNAAAVPEPSSIGLMICGLLGLFAYRRKV